MAISTADLGVLAHYALTNYVKNATDQIRQDVLY